MGYDGLPLCLAPQAPLLNLVAYGIVAMQNPDDDRCYEVDDSLRGYAPICQTCSVRRRCPGVYAGYLPCCESALDPISGTEHGS